MLAQFPAVVAPENDDRVVGKAEALEFIEEDELVEVTPTNIRLRKAVLKELDRKRQARRAVRV